MASQYICDGCGKVAPAGRARVFDWAEGHGPMEDPRDAARLILELRDELNEERETKRQLGDAYRAAQLDRDAAIARRDAALDDMMAAEAETSDMQEQRDAALARVEALTALLHGLNALGEQPAPNYPEQCDCDRDDTGDDPTLCLYHANLFFDLSRNTLSFMLVDMMAACAQYAGAIASAHALLASPDGTTEGK